VVGFRHDVGLRYRGRDASRATHTLLAERAPTSDSAIKVSFRFGVPVIEAVRSLSSRSAARARVYRDAFNRNASSGVLGCHDAFAFTPLPQSVLVKWP
jgi:hypothetical protein